MIKTGSVIISHEMRAGENFTETAGMLWAAVREAATRYPGVFRDLYLDIENEDVTEAAEVACFVHAALGPFLGNGQSENLPDVIVVIGEDCRPVVLTGDRSCLVRDGAAMAADRRLGTATSAAIYIRPGGAFVTEQEVTA